MLHTLSIVSCPSAGVRFWRVPEPWDGRTQPRIIEWSSLKVCNWRRKTLAPSPSLHYHSLSLLSQGKRAITGLPDEIERRKLKRQRQDPQENLASGRCDRRIRYGRRFSVSQY
jgi:hypothetical protein